MNTWISLLQTWALWETVHQVIVTLAALVYIYTTVGPQIGKLVSTSWAIIKTVLWLCLAVIVVGFVMHVKTHVDTGVEAATAVRSFFSTILNNRTEL